MERTIRCWISPYVSRLIAPHIINSSSLHYCQVSPRRMNNLMCSNVARHTHSRHQMEISVNATSHTAASIDTCPDGLHHGGRCPYCPLNSWLYPKPKDHIPNTKSHHMPSVSVVVAALLRLTQRHPITTNQYESSIIQDHSSIAGRFFIKGLGERA